MQRALPELRDRGTVADWPADRPGWYHCGADPQPRRPPADASLMSTRSLSFPASVPAPVWLLLVLVTTMPGSAGCQSTDALPYDPERGVYRPDEIAAGGAEVDPAALLAEGERLTAADRHDDAAEHYLAVAERYPTLVLALESRVRLVDALIRGERLRDAHDAMVELVELYKEPLSLSRNRRLWAELRETWYEEIGLGLFFAGDDRERAADDVEESIPVFERMLREEIRGPYAALCLLRIGDAYYSRGRFEPARAAYLRVVTSYPDYREFHEHEEALYKSALATLGTMKGANYNGDRLVSPGSTTEEKGALDLIRDYQQAYPGGAYRDDAAALRERIHTILAWRDFQAAEVYDKQDYPLSAYTQYDYVVRVWGDATLYPGQQEIVEKARKRRDEIGERQPED
jgi:outer membrane protein assembly factor BamD (BamD/ComL family)